MSQDGVIRLDRFRERVEVDTGPDKPITGRGLKPVYVIADDKREAFAWAHRNKAGFAPKFCPTHSMTVMLGLHLPDEPVYVLRPMPPEVRDRWLKTRCKLVYL